MALLQKGSKVRIKSGLDIRKATQGLPESFIRRWEEIRDSQRYGVVTDVEVMGELECYSVDFGQGDLQEGLCWMRDELITLMRD